MANKIHEEDIRLNISVNGNEAQKEIHNLEKRNNELSTSIKSVQAEMKKYRTAKQKESEDYKNLQSQLNKYNKELDVNRNKISQLTSTLKVNEMTTQQLKARAKELQFALSKMLNATDRNRMKEQLAEVNAQLSKMNALGDQQRLTFSSASGWLQRYQTHILSIAATITGLTYSLQQWIDFSAKLSDAEADVMKTTGLTATEIQKLNKHINTLNTRTSRVELLKLAEEAGRLGKEGIKDIQGFMVVADKLKVALGDDLNETQIRDVGKLVTTYRVATETGKNFEGSMEALGSAINEVSASGANQASFLVDYMNRMAGVASQAKISASDNIGYAATFDEIGQSAEVSSTAMNKVLLDMFHDPTEYAKIAKMSLQDFNKLLNTDSNAAMIKFLEGLNGSEAGLQAMTQKMDELDAGGTRGVAALSALASNLDILKARQLTSNIAIQEATSLTDEFTIKNNNLAAVLDKIKNKVQNWFTSDTLVSWLTTCVTWFAKFIGAVEDTDHKTTAWRNNIILLTKLLLILTVGLVSYNSALKLYAIWTARAQSGTALYNLQLKIQNALAAIAIIRTEGLAIAKMLLTGNIKAAIVQLRLLNATLGLSPIGAVTALVMALATAYVLLKNNTEEANDVMNASVRIQNDIAESTSEQKNRIQNLLSVLKDENASIEQKQRALELLKKITNGYLDTLTLENATTKEGISLIKSYIKHIDDLAKAKAIVAYKAELYTTQLKNNTKITALETEKKNTKDTGSGYGSDGKFFGFDVGRNQKVIQSEIDEAKKSNQQVTNQINVLNSDQEKQIETVQKRLSKSSSLLKKLNKNSKEYKQELAKQKADNDILNSLIGIDDSVTNTAPTTDFNLPTDKKAEKEAEKARKKREREAEKERKLAERNAEKEKADRKKYLDDILKDQEKNNSEILKLKRDLQDAEIDLMHDGFDKELAQLKLKHQREKQDLENQKIDDSTFTTLSNDKAKYTKLKSNSKDANAIAEYDAIIKNIDSMKANFESKNAEINKLITQSELNFWKDFSSIQSKADLKNYDEYLQSIEQRKSTLKFHQNEELANITTVEAGKEALRNTLSERELKRIKTFSDVKKALEKKHRQEEIDLETKILQESIDKLNSIISGTDIETIDFSLLSPDQQKEMQKQLDDLKAKLIELGIEKFKLKSSGNGSENGKSVSLLNGAENVDIFGMSTDQWNLLFDNIQQGKFELEEIVAVVGAMQNAFSKYYSLVNENENRQLERFKNNIDNRKNTLQKQLDQGYISQETYNTQVQKLDDAYNKRKAEIEYKQAKRQRIMDIASVIVNTSMAIMRAYSDLGPIAGTVAAALVGTLGAFQIQQIRKQPLPSQGFEDGYINIQREQDGKNFRAKKGGVAKSGLVSKPTHFLAGEQGQFFPEMIISGPKWKGFSPALKTAVLNEVNGIKSPGYEGGTMPDIASMNNPEIIALLSANFELLSDLKTNGIQAHLVNDMRFQQKMSDGNKKYQQFISKTKM
ncbi:phage tail tape measure protein [Empedobacter brevis]|uniref:phage tail tape measure protein n=1 Tax=Empedobacter brevis TaxID=247 RepID=UPI00334180D8